MVALLEKLWSSFQHLAGSIWAHRPDNLASWGSLIFLIVVIVALFVAAWRTPPTFDYLMLAVAVVAFFQACLSAKAGSAVAFWGYFIVTVVFSIRPIRNMRARARVRKNAKAQAVKAAK